MKPSYRWLALLFLILTGARVHAQAGAPDPAVVLAPYVDEYTVVVGAIDVQYLALDRFFARVGKFAVPKKDLEQAQQFADKICAAFLKAGGRRVYFTLNIADDLDTGPLWIIPVEKGGDAAALAKLFEPLPMFKTQQRQNDVLLGSESQLNKQKNRQAKAVPEIAKGFAALDNAPIRAVAVVPPLVRRAGQELAPRLPKELGGGPITPLVDGLSWAGLGLDFGEQGKARLLIQGKDDNGAKQIQQLINRVIEQIQKEEKDQEALELLDKLLPLFRPQLEGSRLQLVLDEKTFDSAVVPLLGKARKASARAQTINNLKQLALAMHSYHDVSKAFPPQYTLSKQKKPLLSWRVLILPYIEQNALYQEFHLDEPWDSTHNKKLIAKMPRMYRSPLMKAEIAAGKTTYLLPVGPQMVFDGGKKTKITQIPDGTSNTIMILGADDSKAVYWTQPEDFPVERKKTKAGAVRAGLGVLAAFCDGSVRVLPSTLSDEMMWRLFCPNDGQPVEFEEK